MSNLEEAKSDMRKARMANSWGNSFLGGPGNTGGKNVLTGYISTDGKKDVRSYPCHAPIRNFLNADTLWSAFGYRGKKEIAERYLDWLLYKSPWSDTGIVPKLDFDYVFAQGFVFQKLDKTPGNLLHNFLIASRLAAEWPAMIAGWDRLVQEGIDPAYALFAQTLWWCVSNKTAFHETWVGREASTWAQQDRYDWPLDTFRASESYVTNFVNGKTEGLSTTMFFPNCQTTPVNTLWGKLAKAEGEYVRNLKKIYADRFRSEKYGESQFHSAYKMEVADQKDILQIVRDEEIRLGIKKSMKDKLAA